MKVKRIIGSLLLSAGIAVTGYAADKPSFPGGDAALQNYITTHMKYPQAAKDNGVEGVVAVQFLVNTDGSIGAIKIVRMVDPDLEQEAVRLVKNMPAWIPAEQNGQPVEAPAQVSVPFVLE